MVVSPFEAEGLVLVDERSRKRVLSEHRFGREAAAAVESDGSAGFVAFEDSVAGVADGRSPGAAPVTAARAAAVSRPDWEQSWAIPVRHAPAPACPVATRRTGWRGALNRAMSYRTTVALRMKDEDCPSPPMTELGVSTCEVEGRLQKTAEKSDNDKGVGTLNVFQRS